MCPSGCIPFRAVRSPMGVAPRPTHLPPAATTPGTLLGPSTVRPLVSHPAARAVDHHGHPHHRPSYSTPSLPFPPGLGSHRSSLAPQGHHVRAYPMQHVVSKSLTRWVAANLISSYFVHAGNHKHGSAGHDPSRGRTPKAADLQVFGKPIPTEGGRQYTH